MSFSTGQKKKVSLKIALMTFVIVNKNPNPAAQNQCCLQDWNQITFA
jgi:hypothetical protein